jgi:enamine deaminase RidA (YjgF/YER057c/UK114 family)
MKDILTAESISFSDIVRQWNYVENIVEVNTDDGNKPVQNYQVLNDTRSVYYSQLNFQHGYPAATGIGMNYGGILLEFYAVMPFDKVEIVPVKNPKQVDAYNYSQEVLVGDSIKELPQKTTPKFERAKYLSMNGHKTIFISGTASIHNEVTIGIDDVEKQTLVTLENISELVTNENLTNSGASDIEGILNYSFLRIYVKESSDLEIVKSICDKKFNNTSISYLIADICRDNLLVEIEGVAELLQE